MCLAISLSHLPMCENVKVRPSWALKRSLEWEARGMGH